MLEARQACSGATGRNGGHTKAASYRSFLDHERQLGLVEAVKIARMEYANVEATHAFARDHGIECASTPCATVDILYSKVQWDLSIRAIERMRAVMGEGDPAAKYEIFNSAQTAEKFRCPGAVGAFQYPAGSLSAYDFTTGVLQLALEKGLDLQTNTPATAIYSSGSKQDTTWRIDTLRGSIATPNPVVATNGYTAPLLPQMQGLIVPLHGQVIAHRPGSGIPQNGLPTTYSFIRESGYEYMITRPPGSKNEGDIVIGGGLWQLPNAGESRYGNTDDSVLDPTIRDYLRHCTADYFGSNWVSTPPNYIKKEWSGIMGASADGLPYVGAVPDHQGLWISASFNGHGMVWCLKSAEALVAMMTGDEAEQRVVDSWFPRSARISKERMKLVCKGRRDLRAPGETAFGQRRSRL